MEVTLKSLRDQFTGLCVEILGPDGSCEADPIVIGAAVDDWIEDAQKNGKVSPVLDYVEGYIGQEGPWCNQCGCPCSTEVVDNGVGVTEFWGHKSTHVQYDIESTCCDGVPYSDPLLTVEIEGEGE